MTRPVGRFGPNNTLFRVNRRLLIECEHYIACVLQVCECDCISARSKSRIGRWGIEDLFFASSLQVRFRSDCRLESWRAMSTFNTVLRAVGFAAFLTVSVSAQTLSSRTFPEKPDSHLASLTKKALAGDTWAELQLGIAFEFGQGVDRNLDEAMRWYRMAADRGEPVAQTNLGYLYEIGGNGPANPEEAAKWYLRAAVSGLVRAQFNLGTLYLRGAGVQKSDEDAAHWIGEAADAGCPTAEAALGYMYASGKGVPRDEQKARELTQKAEKKNDPRLCAGFSRQVSDALLFH